MLVVHGFWSRQWGACVWAEDSELTVKSHSQAIRAARKHTFAADAQIVSRIHAGTARSATLLLPSLRSAPLDSPELVRAVPRPANRLGPMLLAWSVPVVQLTPGDVFTVATALEQPEVPEDPADAGRYGASVRYLPEVPEVFEDPAEVVRYGASVRYLAGLAAFAGSLVERGRVLPTFGHDFGHDSQDGAGGGESKSRWRPVLQGPDILTLHALVAAMPPVFRAESDGPADVDGREPNDLVSTALDVLVDAAMRVRLAGADLLAAYRDQPPTSVAAAEAWLVSLSTVDGRFAGELDEIDALRQALKEWADFGIGPSGPARATFRLTEVLTEVLPEAEVPARGLEWPDEPYREEAVDEDGGTVDEGSAVQTDGRWRLEFLLQSTEDPSLLVPAEQVWSAGMNLRRWLDSPEELLLTELGRASRIYPELAPALRQATPCALELDADGAYRFLSSTAELLDGAGFGVLLPSWWDRRRRLGLTLSTSGTPIEGVVTTKSKFGRHQLVDFRWELALGEDVLTEEELSTLADAKAPLVRLRGQWVAAGTEQIRRGLEFLARTPPGRKTAGEVLALAASHPADLDLPLPLEQVRADGWLGDLLNGTADRSLRPVQPPQSLHATLRPYQERGLSWLAFLTSLGLGACLADDMGLGKTLQLLALEAWQRAEQPGAAATLLICPMSLVGNWQREASKFVPGLRVYAHHGPGRQHGEELVALVAGVDLVVTTYATAARDIDELDKIEWHRVALDEAQAVKNSLSQSAKAVRRLRAEHRVALTGTPVENRLAELWSVMDFLNPGILGSSELFRTRYAIPVERHLQTEPAERLRAITRPYILRRLKTDPTIIDDLPDKIEIKQYCHLTAEQASLYKAVVDDMMKKIENTEGIERRGHVLAAMAKLKQVCNHPAQLMHDRSAIGRRSGKVIRLEELLTEIIAEGDRVLCFTQFTEFAEMLLPHLAAQFRQDILFLHGGTPKPRRDEMVQRFQSGEGPSIFLLSLRAGGVGLNLTAANHVIHLDRWWNPAVENQATDRAFRIGQQRNVQVRKFICVGTLEEKIDEMIEDKKALANMVIGDGEGWLTELSTGALREVFTLGEGAVSE